MPSRQADLNYLFSEIYSFVFTPLNGSSLHYGGKAPHRPILKSEARKDTEAGIKCFFELCLQGCHEVYRSFLELSCL